MLIVNKMPLLNLEGAAFLDTRAKNRSRLISTKKNLRPTIS